MYWRGRRVKGQLADQRGMGTVEIILIVAVLVTLALLFRKFIVELAEQLFDKIQQNADAAVQDI